MYALRGGLNGDPFLPTHPPPQMTCPLRICDCDLTWKKASSHM